MKGKAELSEEDSTRDELSLLNTDRESRRMVIGHRSVIRILLAWFMLLIILFFLRLLIVIGTIFHQVLTMQDQQ